MQMMFRYNWQVREDWYRWCENIPEEELLRKRTGGVGGILHTLYHIVDVEWSWIREIQGSPSGEPNFEEYSSLEKVRALDATYRIEVEEFVQSWDEQLEYRLYHDIMPDGRSVTDTWGEVMRHIIAHEIHHMGQLSIWSRELGKKPISANLIGRGVVPIPKNE